MSSENLDLFKPSVDELATLVEECARAGKQNISRFIEPAQGTLRRATSKRHHMIFGRRGSGKSSLLLKSADELVKRGNPVAFVDLEPFKGHHYPDILISVLLATFSKFKTWLETCRLEGSTRRLWYTLFLVKKKTDVTKAREQLLASLEMEIKQLSEQLQLSDDSPVRYKTSQDQTTSKNGNVSFSYPLGDGKLETNIARSLDKRVATEVEEDSKRSKKDFLLRKIIDYQGVFNQLFSIKKMDSYLFLDDLYHIVRSDQPSLIDYFHKIAKGNNLWIKIATIRNRTTWYVQTSQPIGVKIGDDIEEINLDLTLEKFSTLKEFLKSILDVYITETGAPDLQVIINDSGIDRLVLSSGGVARDFLGLFRRSIDEARERLKRSNFKHARGEKIGAEDVNIAAGNYGELKREEFQRDTPEDRSRLEESYNRIRAFCLETSKRNIFLVDQEQSGEDIELLQELLDLRLLHQIRSRVTVSVKPGKIFKAYLLDVSQYTGERARRDIEMIEFWRDPEKEKLRRSSSIYNPYEVTPPIKTAVIKGVPKAAPKGSIEQDGEQMKFEM